MGSGTDAQLKVCLARVQMEVHEKAEDRGAEMRLRLEVRRLEIKAETQIKLRELKLNAAKNAPVPAVTSEQAGNASAAFASTGTSFDASKHISLVPQFRESEVDSYLNALL